MSKLGGIGIWSGGLRFGDPGEIAAAATELEALGYRALWIPDVGGPVTEALDLLLGATTTITAATGILNAWKQSAADVAAWWKALPSERSARVQLGLGVSHAALIGDDWTKPIAVMRRFLDELDAGGLPAEHRCLAALGPQMLRLARERTAGAHPYLVTPEHTAIARAALGDGLLAVEQGVVLETDAGKAREIGRAGLSHYCGLPNYTNNWKRLGFTEEDVATCSDRLVDGLIGWGDLDAVAARIDAHFAAGADHVCVQVLTVPGVGLPLAEWRELAALTRR